MKIPLKDSLKILEAAAGLTRISLLLCTVFFQWQLLSCAPQSLFES